MFLYDESDAPIGLLYRESSYAEEVFDEYYFTKNLQGDIIGIYDEEGNLVAEYTYNAWGEHTVTNHTSANIGNINPFRYRGYFYDSETGYYYLNTRYYNPQIKRFISADNINYLGANGDLNSYNLYAYCSNNPVTGYDPMGMWTISQDIHASAACLVGVYYSLALVIDSEWNIAIQLTSADPSKNNNEQFFSLPGAGVGSYTTLIWSNVTIDDLTEGDTISAGGSGNVVGPLALGGDVLVSPTDGVVGVTTGANASAGVDVHIACTTTTTICKGNIKEAWKSFWKWVRGE